MNIRKIIRDEMQKSIFSEAQLHKEFEKTSNKIFDNIKIVFSEDFVPEEVDYMIVKKNAIEHIKNQIDKIKQDSFINNPVSVIKLCQFQVVKDNKKYKIRFELNDNKYDYFYLILYRDIVLSLNLIHGFFDDKIAVKALKDVKEATNDNKLTIENTYIVDSYFKTFLISLDPIKIKHVPTSVSAIPKIEHKEKYNIGDKVKNPLYGFGIIVGKRKSSNNTDIINVLYPKDVYMFNKFRIKIGADSNKEPNSKELKEYLKEFPYEKNINIWISKSYDTSKV